MTVCLSTAEVEAFQRDGFLLLPDFYDLSHEIEPIQRGIHDILTLLCAKHGLTAPVPFDVATFDEAYARLIRLDRRIGGVVYDAVKQIPAFIRLLGVERHEGLFRQLRSTDLPGIAAGGSGIRIDNPQEEQFRADWHQEYPAQFRSPDGLVYWSPLVPIEADMGPVHICRGSHKDGLRRVHVGDPDHPEKSGAYALVLENRDQVVGKYEEVAPLSNPGDLLLMDFMTLHASGHNRSARSRWSMQFRYFNFSHPEGVRTNWPGAYAFGKTVRDVWPELVAEWPKGNP